MGFKIYNFIDYTFQSKFDNIYPMSVARLATHAKGERETNSLVKEGARKARKHGREEKAKIVSERGEMTQLKHIKN